MPGPHDYVRATQYPGLGYQLVDAHNVTTQRRERDWRFVDRTTGAHIGQPHPTRESLLAALDSYAKEGGWDQ